MDIDVLSQVIGEASLLLSGARVDRVYETERGDIILLFRIAGRQVPILVAPDRSLPRVHLLSRKPPAGPSLHRFTLYLKSRIAGARVAQCGLLDRDRIVKLDFDSRGGSFTLLVELFGPRTNLIMLDREGIIQAVYYPAGISGAANRPLIAGVRYSPPPRKHDSGEHPAGIAGNTDRTDGCCPVNSRIEKEFEAFLERKQIEDLRTELLAAIGKASGRVERRLEALNRDLAESGRSDEYREQGDLILANLHRLTAGMPVAELETADGGVRRIALDPRRAPAANAEQYYKRYKKARTGRAIIERRSAEAVRELSALGELSAQLKEASSESDLVLLQDRIGRSGLLPGPARNAAKRAAPPADPFRKVSFRGWEILVGRNARGNDYVTTRLARDRDLWLHAEGMPGSHVLVRNPRSSEIPPDVLEFAASIAAHYSKGRGSGKVPVAYTFARFVRKPKGAKPGLVTLAERKTIMAVPRAEQGEER